MARSSIRIAAHAAVVSLLSTSGISSTAFADAYSDAIGNTSGLVGYWRLNEASGNYADSSSQGNVGAPDGNVLQGVAGPRPSDGLLGFDAGNNAAGFDASDGSEAVVINNPVNAALDAHTGDLTYSVWFKGPNDGGDYFLLSKMNSSRDGYAMERLPTSSNANFDQRLNAILSPDASTAAIGPVGSKPDADKWTNAVVVLHRNRTSGSSDYNSSGVSIFVNGQWFDKQVSASFDGSPGIDSHNTLPLLIGAFRQTVGGWLSSYTGSIDDVSVFNRALSPVEIQQLYSVASTGSAGTVQPMWKVAGGGNWSDTANWFGGVPSGTDAVANMGAAIGAGSTITLDSAYTVGTINFANSNRYTIAGPGTLTISATTAGGINLLNFNHTILAPLNLQSSTTVNVVYSNRTLTLSGTVNSSPGSVLTKIGAGTLLTNQGLHVGGLDVQKGVVRVGTGTTSTNEPARTSVLGSLNIASTSGFYTARFDLGNSSAIIDYTGSSPISTVAEMVRQGYSGGTWSGGGIGALSAATVAVDGAKIHKTALGFAEASALGVSSFAGQTLSDNTAILIAYTLYGDADLDGKVTTVDFNSLAGNFSLMGKIWSDGDFNYNGTVDSVDFNALANNYGSNIATATGPLLGSVVPEPGCAAVIFAGGLLGVRRRNRSVCC